MKPFADTGYEPIHYYPGGMVMPGRKYSIANTNYRYGFNGKELDKEDPVQYDYGFRIYDPRLIRFKSLDPLQKRFPELTPYQFASNSPIANVDLDGRESEYYTKTITFVRVHQKLPNGEYKLNKTQETYVDHLKTGFFPDGPLGSGTLYTVRSQVKEVFLDVNGSPEAPPCYAPFHVLKRLYKFSDNDLKEDNRPIFKGKFQLMVFGSAHDDSESPGERPNPSAKTEIIDMRAFMDILEPVLIARGLKLPDGAPKLTELIGDDYDAALDKLNKESIQERHTPSYERCAICKDPDHVDYGIGRVKYNKFGEAIDTLRTKPGTGETETIPNKDLPPIKK